MNSTDLGRPFFEPAGHRRGRGKAADLYDGSRLQIGPRHTLSQADYQRSRLENGIPETNARKLAMAQEGRLEDSRESDCEFHIPDSEP